MAYRYVHGSETFLFKAVCGRPARSYSPRLPPDSCGVTWSVRARLGLWRRKGLIGHEKNYQRQDLLSQWLVTSGWLCAQNTLRVEIMEIARAVTDFGTEAVLRYREISEGQDNELPEHFLSAFIALRLYEAFRKPVHMERLYTILAHDLGIPLSDHLINQVGAYRADVAVYDSPSAPAIIELKIFDERRDTSLILYDRGKAERMSEFVKLDAYLGILICETSNGLRSRIGTLEDLLGRKVFTGPEQWSRGNKWRWCFGCIALQP
jgi:hypothetical protein